jgi:pre-rRNA-processing protein RIX1
LVREITTPSLPGFITALLNLVNGKKASDPLKSAKELPLLETVLSAFTELISRHPTLFRPFVGQLQKLLLPIIASSTTTCPLSSKAFHISQELYVALHHCAPKNTSSEQWASACKNTTVSIHQVADHVFRSVVEQWESSDPNYKHGKMPKDMSDTPQANKLDALGLPLWQGLPAGAIRLTALLNLLSKFISIRTSSVINFPLGAIIDLLSRLTSVTVSKANEDTAQSNSEFSREERMTLYMELPMIHTACIDLFRAIVSTLQTGVTPVLHTIFEQTLWVFEAENFNSGLRESSYLLMSELLPLVGRSFAKANVFALSALIKQCCRDLVPADVNRGIQEQPNTSKGSSKNTQVNMNVDALLNPTLKESNSVKEGAPNRQNLAAMTLLPLLYNYLPTEYLPLPVRTEMERVAILTANRSAMVASVMNPMPPIKGRRPIPSILPFLTRKYAKHLEVECLVRPRMPVLLGNTGEHFDAEDYEENEDSAGAEAVVAPSTGIQDLSSITTNPAQPKDTIITPPETTQNKRALVAESGPSNQLESHLSQTVLEQSLHQAKKARLEGNNVIPVVSASVPVTLSEVSASPAVLPLPTSSTPFIPAGDSEVPSLNSVTANTQSLGATNSTSAGPANDADDSDDEMPTLNLEPDTDDEDDE